MSTEFFRRLKTSKIYQSLDTITTVNGKWWGDDDLRYQLDNEIRKQPWKSESSCGANQPFNAAWTRTQHWKKIGVNEIEELAVDLFWAFFARLLCRFGGLLDVFRERSPSFRKLKSIFFNSISRLWCNALNWIQRSRLICIFEQIKSFTMQSTGKELLFSNSSSESNLWGVRSRWWNTSALSLPWRVSNTFIRSGTDNSCRVLLLCLPSLIFNKPC